MDHQRRRRLRKFLESLYGRIIINAFLNEVFVACNNGSVAEDKRLWFRKETQTHAAINQTLSFVKVKTMVRFGNTHIIDDTTPIFFSLRNSRQLCHRWAAVSFSDACHWL